MNEEAKIQLSGREMELVNNTEWIFTKQLIIEKVYPLLGQLHHDYKKIIEKAKIDFFPELCKTREEKFRKVKITKVFLTLYLIIRQCSAKKKFLPSELCFGGEIFLVFLFIFQEKVLK